MAIKSIKFLASSEEWQFEAKDGEHIDSISLQLTLSEGKITRKMVRDFLKSYDPDNMLTVKIIPNQKLGRITDTKTRKFIPSESEIEIEELSSLTD